MKKNYCYKTKKHYILSCRYKNKTDRKRKIMKINEIIEVLKKNAGCNIPAVWTRTLKSRKDMPIVIKTTVAHVRGGIDFSNLASVKNAIANGEREEVQSLPWGIWACFPVHIEHNGNDYCRLYPASFDNLKPQVSYRLAESGEIISREMAEQYCLASEFSKGDEKPDCFTLKAESLVSLG